MTRIARPLAIALLLGTAPLYTQSLIGQARYRIAPEDTQPPLLHPGHAWNELEPLPRVEIPEQLPPELSLPPDQLEAWTQLQRAHRALVEDKPGDALEIYRAHLEKHPRHLQIRLALADTLYSLQRYQEAETAYLDVLERRPYLFQALNNLAWMYATVPTDHPVHQPETAHKLAVRARLVMPQSHHVWSTLSQIHYALGHYQESVDAARQTLILARNSTVPPKVRVQYQVQLDKSRTALQATSILE